MKIKSSILVLLCTVMLVGCTDNKENSSAPQGNNNQQEQLKDNPANEESDTTSDNKDSEDTESASKDSSEDIIKLKIYTLNDEDTETKEVFSEIELDNNKPLKDKLNDLCLALQKDFFKEGNALIRLEGIDSNGVATVNLVNSVEGAWNKHFAGSTGGYISQMTIIDTLLQKDYDGEWIKGLKILIDGESGLDKYDHAPFEESYNR